MAARTAMAPKVPHRITWRCVFFGRLRATRPMIRALSPASTRSIRTMANRADTKPDEKSSGCMKSLQRKRNEVVFSSELYGYLLDGAPVRRAQGFHDGGCADHEHGN